MQIVREIITLPESRKALRASGTVALVPTMGALHAGHLALVAEARRRADRVAATIFVNPLQFDDAADLMRYPRSEEADLAQLEQAGCDFVWLPSTDEIYPAGFSTTIHVPGVSERWEGEHRPGHFDGVATVVAKLLIAVMPDLALFGDKDFQQLAVIRRLVADLALPVEVVSHHTVREDDGLAMSSRNTLLSEEQRRLAPTVFAALRDAAKRVVDGETVEVVLTAAKQRLTEAGFDPVDYVAYVDEIQLEPLSDYRPGGRLIAAATLGPVRLIDNLRVP